MRWLWLALAMGLASVFALAPAARDRLLYNGTSSVPTGFYLRDEEATIAPGVFVTVRAREVAFEAARARGFTGDRDRFIKRIAAMAGDHVCAGDNAVIINETRRVSRRAYDSTGAPLTGWSGCRRLEPGEVLLLGDSADSFDGRYWGPVDSALIEGVWRPL